MNFHAPFVLSQLALAEMIPRAHRRDRQHLVGRRDRARTRPVSLIRRSARAAARATARRRRRSSASRRACAAEVYQYGVSVTCVSPSQIVPTPGTVYHRLVKSIDDPRGEAPELMAKAALLLATEPLERVTGRVTYSQQILKEFGWISDGRGRGVETPRQRLLADLARLEHLVAHVSSGDRDVAG